MAIENTSFYFWKKISKFYLNLGTDDKYSHFWEVRCLCEFVTEISAAKTCIFPWIPLLGYDHHRIILNLIYVLPNLHVCVFVDVGIQYFVSYPVPQRKCRLCATNSHTWHWF